MINGYTHRFGKVIGGIKQIQITPACNIKDALVDPRSGHYISVILHDPDKLAPYSFAEDAAAYREETRLQNGIPSVKHILEFHTDKIDQDSDRLIRQLTDSSCCGLAAIVTTRNHIRLVVGYSDEHRAERPLKLQNIAADSGKKHTDTGHEAISLSSLDTVKARILDGQIE